MDIGDAKNNGQKLVIYKNFLDKETRRLDKKFTGYIKIKSWINWIDYDEASFSGVKLK